MHALAIFYQQPAPFKAYNINVSCYVDFGANSCPLSKVKSEHPCATPSKTTSTFSFSVHRLFDMIVSNVDMIVSNVS